MVQDSEHGSWRRAGDDEKGEVVIAAQYPYMALTVWCAEGFGTSGWRCASRAVSADPWPCAAKSWLPMPTQSVWQGRH
eukprot:4911419-Prymnesium_polylepis.1